MKNLSPDKILFNFGISAFILIFSTAVFAGTNNQAHNLFGSPGDIFTITSSNGPAISGPKISTEKSSYKLGESVSITGEGFLPEEIVSLSIEETSGGESIVTERWTLYADAKGRISATWSVNPIQSTSSKFTITATGEKSGTAQTIISSQLAPAGNLDQCANGGVGDPPIVCTDAAWQNGNLNQNQAHYVEGQSVPYRLRMTDLTIGASNTVTIEYDTTQGSKHALDYLTSFARTETTADPCSGVAGCNLATFTTMPIPVDSNVANGPNGVPGGGDDIAQIPGVFTLYGGTITAVSSYTMAGSFAGNSQTSITITFTSDTTNPVLAWGGHIATRANWGNGNSAVDIAGSPYHMRLLDLNGGGGNQDRALAAAAVLFSAKVTIIQNTLPDNPQDFPFTSTGFTPFAANLASSFTLDDDADGTLPNMESDGAVSGFGIANTKTVTQGFVFGWGLTNLVCVEIAGPGGTSIANSTTSIPTKTATIVAEEGEEITCTFTNAAPTAAAASISGQVLNPYGRAFGNATVTLTNTNSGETFTTRTSTFGYFRFEEQRIGDFYVLEVNSKRYQFDSRSFTLDDDLTDIIIQAN